MTVSYIFFTLLIYQKIPFLNLIELKSIDARFLARGPVEPGSDIVMAVIDEKSIAKEGKWIWPRSKFADLVTRLSDAGARVIAFDLGFLEADDKRTLTVIDTIRQTAEDQNIQTEQFNRSLDRLKSQLDNDELLAAAIENAKAHVVLGYFFQFEKEAAAEISPQVKAGRSSIQSELENIKGSRYTIIEYGPNPKKLDFADARGVQSNIKKISRSTGYSGYFNKTPDREDGVVRRIETLFRYSGKLHAPLSLVTASAYLGKPLSVNISDNGIQEVRIGERVIPTDYAGRLFINYRGGKEIFPRYSITDILHGTISDEQFKDKIVMVSPTASGINDEQVTPMDELMPGAEIHANVIDNILSDDFLKMPSWGGLVDAITIILAGFFLSIMLYRAGAVSGAIITALTIGSFYVLSYYLFVEKAWILNLTYLTALIFFIYTTITILKYIDETKQKRFIKSVFSTYLAPSVVKYLLKSPGKLLLGGEERDIVAFFSDVEGFTSVSESLTPTELVELLNEFLTEMTDIITQYEGTVDKFEGDAIIAFFGAPNDILDKKEVACRVCIDMQKRLIALRRKWQSENRPELKMRIGIYSGKAIVGNMGSKNRMDYTMIGDTVNTAARLEGVNKIYGTYILTGENTAKASGDDIVKREIDTIFVVGKEEPLNIYQIWGYSKDLDTKTQELFTYYAKGLAAYRNQDWERGIDHFKTALTLIPEDGPSKTMLKRCMELKKNPFDDSWNGIYSMTSK